MASVKWARADMYRPTSHQLESLPMAAGIKVMGENDPYASSCDEFQSKIIAGRWEVRLSYTYDIGADPDQIEHPEGSRVEDNDEFRDPMPLIWVDVFDWFQPKVEVFTDTGNNVKRRIQVTQHDGYLIDEDFSTIEQAQKFYDNIEAHIFLAVSIV